ncbi:LOW QUALITY PROTEIN: uncharacterized protein LOC120267551 [Dioscorea cayenensis subsp. rotundata]|uniref:LOW QUALITY PROTEIN: uncharacterized protein LOC120267551 n=1 Tax=Dioscorea cayennensis subsp. rotundata TaxID=55577 RepID=A0AB40BY63_DIOCR|nr:LOW QUALITY PROTEIN: uncharacterized protein LOC120267551 [Dioscorea cayenensis subsp. rotundata]
MLRSCAVRLTAPSPPLLLSSPLSAPATRPTPASPNPILFSSMPPSIRIAVVGDVHDDWDLQEDSKALHFLQPDLVLFTGDFGNENVELVKSISKLELPKATILGNHDCWHTYQFSEKKVDRVQLQLACLGEQHVGYNHLDFPALKLNVVGGRPFSCGGERLFRPRLLSARYGVNCMESSAKRIVEAALGTPEGHCIVLLAHNGPTGLGSKMNDICGKDWVYGGGDHGDPDLAQAILDLKRNTQFPIPLVMFGHMHKELAYRSGLRKMIVIDSDNTIYLNGAIVPRVKSVDQQATTSSEISTEHSDTKNGTLRAFTLVEMIYGMVEKVSETWVSVIGETTSIAEEILLFKKP